LKYSWIIWLLNIPIFLFAYLDSFFLASKIAYEPQEECKQKFIFTPQDVQYCSDIYPIDIFLIALKTYPLSYVCLASGIFFIAFPIYRVLKKKKIKKK
jgi:hypothetical protein